MVERSNNGIRKPIMMLKSREGSGVLYPGKNVAILRRKRIALNGNLAFSPGDSISINGETYVIMNPNPTYFKDFADRGAQIVQPWDAAAIIRYCNITPGMTILESGAGSGALSYAILSALGNSGSLVTIEREQRYMDLARRNLDSIATFENWSLIKGDMTNIKLERMFDAAILDLPEPWSVIRNVSSSLKPGSMMSCYLPTFNQVEKTVMSFEKEGVRHLETFELIKRDLLVRESAVRPDNKVIGHTAFLVFAIRTSGVVFD